MNEIQRRSAIIRNRQISLVLDIGANKGQYGKRLRDEVRYKGRIVSFEPLLDAFSILQQTAAFDPLWKCYNIAFGDSRRSATINISDNSHSSSLLAISSRAVEFEPSVAFVGTQEISVYRLDSLLDQFAKADDRIFLNIDTQGYELNILNGALGVINRFNLIQLETSFIEVYHGGALIGDVVKFLDYLGYRLISVERGWECPTTGELLQADLIVGRK